MDSTDTKLARIEAGMEHLKDSMGEVKKAIIPMAKTVNAHGTDIALLKRDRKWLIGIGSALIAASHVLGRFFK